MISHHEEKWLKFPQQNERWKKEKSFKREEKPFIQRTSMA